ncbi:hypothetical protein AX17_001828 [Amanita inopinata Kibby_2008]|nr:hypothetical protein AX17_001828 [Amanita inopinata Kibby_2008]
MNPTPTSNTIATLCYRVDIYLEHIARLLTIRDQPFLPSPFPDDATRLPPDFPDVEFVHTTYIYWQDEEDFYQLYEVKLCHFNPDSEATFVAWEILIRRSGVNESRAQLGLLEINKELYGDQQLFQFTGAFILKALRMSVRLGTPIRVTRRVLPVSPAVQCQRQLLFEVVEMCDACGRVLRELARRQRS